MAISTPVGPNIRPDQIEAHTFIEAGLAVHSAPGRQVAAGFESANLTTIHSHSADTLARRHYSA